MTLDLNKPSFQRSASKPSAVCATWKEETEGERRHVSQDKVNVCAGLLLQTSSN